MLSEKERLEIEDELTHYPTRDSACIDAMKVIQRHRGWVSDESIFDVAQLLGMSPAEVDGIATFYNLIFRKPVGRHVILVCDSVSCWIMGYDGILAYLRDRLNIGPGETTSDGRFTLLPVVCLGACDHAPVMMIDRDLHMDLDPEKIDTVLEKYQ